MRLAGSTVAYGYDVLATLDVLAARKLPVHRRYCSEVEGVDALYDWEAGGLDPACHQAVSAVYRFKFRPSEQVVGVIHSLRGALHRYLAVLLLQLPADEWSGLLQSAGLLL